MADSGQSQSPAPDNKRNTTMAITGAVVTLLIIGGVLAAPRVNECSSSEAGLVSCLFGGAEEVGQPDAADSLESEAETPDIVVADVPEDEAATPMDDSPAAAETASRPVLGLVRAEPDGNVLIAGSAPPGTEVEVFSNGESLGVAEAESSGDWVLIPDAPLPAGTTEITVGITDSDLTSANMVTVTIDEDKSSAPIVVASREDEAAPAEDETLVVADLPESSAPDESDLMSSEPEAMAEPEVMEESEPEAEPESEPMMAEESEEPELAEETDEMVAEEPVEAVSEPEPEMVAEEEPAAETPVEEPVPAETAESEEPAVVEEPVVADEPDMAEEPVEEPVAESDEPDMAVADTMADEPAVEEEAPAEDTMDVAILDEEPAVEAEPEPVLPLIPPTIDAIEVEDDASFFAGAGEDGANIRLFVSNAYISETIVSGGRWLIEAGPVLDDPVQRVRVEMWDGSRSAEAEVIFVLPETEPETEEPIVVAEAEPEVTEEPEPAPEPEMAEEPAPEPEATEEAGSEPETVEPEEPIETEMTADAEKPATTTEAEATETAAVSEKPKSEPETAEEDIVVADVPGEELEMAESAEPADEQVDTSVLETENMASDDAREEPSSASESSGEEMDDSANTASTAENASTMSEPESAAEEPEPVEEVEIATAPESEPGDADVTEPEDAEMDASGAMETETAELESEPEGEAAALEITVALENADPFDFSDADLSPEVQEALEVARTAPQTLTAAQIELIQTTVPILIAQPVGGDESGRFSTGRAIIRSGDNLWTIASRVYGDGFRYQEIFDANEQFINRPDLIYPGQLFQIPANALPAPADE